MAYCTRQCAAEGYTLKGCVWLADLKLDWEGRLYDAGGRYAITHCCCDYPVLSKEATQAARDRWENIRESFREDWSKTRCYAGGPPWNTVGPDLPYSDY